MSYSSEVLADSPGAYFRMGEASGQPQDSSGNGNHTVGTTGTPTYSQSGATSDGNTAIRLPGTASNGFSANPASSLSVADVYTCEAWIKLAATGQYHEIFNKGTGAYQFRIDNTGAIQLVKDSTALIVTATATITDTTTWHHVVATKNGATVKLYLDGADVTGTVTNATCTNTAQSFVIGRSSGGVNPANATLDELALYPTALSAARVGVHYSGAVASSFVPRVSAVY